MSSSSIEAWWLMNVHWTSALDGELRSHAHIVLSMREVCRGGFGKSGCVE